MACAFCCYGKYLVCTVTLDQGCTRLVQLFPYMMYHTTLERFAAEVNNHFVSLLHFITSPRTSATFSRKQTAIMLYKNLRLWDWCFRHADFYICIQGILCMDWVATKDLPTGPLLLGTHPATNPELTGHTTLFQQDHSFISILIYPFFTATNSFSKLSSAFIHFAHQGFIQSGSCMPLHIYFWSPDAMS